MLEKLRQRSSEESGFTLVELLVVMLILGILAAIAIPTFFNQRNKAKDASAKEAARTAQTAMETYALDNGGSYASATTAKLVAIEQTLQTADLTVTNPTATGYTVTYKSTTGNTFSITKTGGTTSFDCVTKGDGGCPSDGNWASTS
jgi:type IV pilus assembly protein PilA